MSVRLQVLLDEAEIQEIREIAQRRHLTVSEWVRQVLRRARRDEPRLAARRKVAAIEAAARHAFPAADIDEMNAQIERGYSGEAVG